MNPLLTVILFLIVPLVCVAEDAAWPCRVIAPGPGGPDGARVRLVDGEMLIVTPWEEGGRVMRYRRPAHEKVRQPWPGEVLGKQGDGEDAVQISGGLRDAVVLSAHEGKTSSVALHQTQGSAWSTRILDLPKRMWMWLEPAGTGPEGFRVVMGSKGQDAGIGLAHGTATGDWSWRALRPADWVMTLALVDVDQDGKSEILYTDRLGPRSAVGLLHDWEDGTPRDEPLGGGGEWMFAAAGQLDGGMAIVAARKPGDLVLLRRKADAWTTEVVPLGPGTGTTKGVAIGDLDGDGREDLAFTCEHAHGRVGVGYLTRLGSKSGAWHRVDVGGPFGKKFDTATLIDIDADGDLDLLTCEEREIDAVLWYENPLRGGRHEPGLDTSRIPEVEPGD